MAGRRAARSAKISESTGQMQTLSFVRQDRGAMVWPLLEYAGETDQLWLL